ncbi:MAG: dihydrodipicolinate synthase family protein [Actinobacteria bacterium]|nr:dihydrodipicolinate synthase family protein [Actinomycetota bacterium]
MNDDMRQGLTRANLHGIWSALTTPFTADNKIDTGVIRENVRRCHAVGLHGVYTTDSDGEFYAIEFDEFKLLVDAFADECVKLNMPSQVGVTWYHTQGIVDRLRFAASRGVMGAHVGHPTFMPMSDASFVQFWRDVSDAVPAGFGLIQYNTPRQPHVLAGTQYQRLAEAFPKLIGTKYVQSDIGAFVDTIAQAPQLAYFAGEHALTALALFGARGAYSWFANFNPTYCLAWWDDIVQHRWAQAAERQARVAAFGRLAKSHLREDGHLHGIVNKAMAAAGTFAAESNWYTRKPYLPVSQGAVDRFKQVVEEQFADLIYRP